MLQQAVEHQLYLVLEESVISGTWCFMLLQLVKVYLRADIEIGPFVCGNKTEAGQK